MTFRTSCLIGAAITAALFGVLLATPQLVFWLFGTDGGASAELLTRRAAVLLLGLAATLWLARDVPLACATRSRSAPPSPCSGWPHSARSSSRAERPDPDSAWQS